jgi:hypothetical protein
MPETRFENPITDSRQVLCDRYPDFSVGVLHMVTGTDGHQHAAGRRQGIGEFKQAEGRGQRDEKFNPVTPGRWS